jgi:hypothetical protein
VQPPRTRTRAPCAIVYRGGGYCAWCGRALTKGDCQIDHVVPRREGGSSEPDNLVPACSRCNVVRPDVPGWLDQLAEPLDLWAGLQLALVWYPWMAERWAAATLKTRDRRREVALVKCLANRGTEFPFGACG